MMHSSCTITTSTNLYDPYYYYSSPTLFPSSPLYHLYTHEDGYKSYNSSNIEEEFFQDSLENRHEIMIQPQQQNPLENNYNINNNDKCQRVESDKIINNSPRKKIIKKDRQTKIQTAQGPRDRRMRLSLNIARKFFDLQDMLGFDKASQTVEWLLTKSISSITELSRSFKHQVGTQNSVSSTSKIPMDAFSSDVNLEKGMLNNNNKTSESKKGKTKVRTIRPLAIAKKLREEARKRARERTKEKMISNLQKRREVAGITDGVGYGCSLVGAGSWIPSSNTFLDLQQNGGIIHGLKIPELKNSSGNPGEEAANCVSAFP